MQLAQFHAEWVIYYPHPSAVEGLPIKFHTFNAVGKPQALIYSNLGLDIFKLATSILIILIPKEHISVRKCLMPQENSMKRMFTHKDSIKKIIFSNYLPLSLALNSSSEQFSPNWARFTSTPLNSALSHFRQRADGAIWTFLDKHTFLPLRVIYLLSMRSMWGNFLYFSRYKLQNYKTKLFRPPY